MSKEVTLDQIKELRERTGVGMGKCKEALVSSNGDLEKAIDFLRKSGMASGVKKEGRETKEGVVFAGQNAQSLVLIEGNAETDFVTQNERFKGFISDCLDQALASDAQDVSSLLEKPYAKEPSLTLEQQRNLVIQALGENIQVRRLEKIQKHTDASYGIYSHMGGKLVVVVEIQGSSQVESLAKEIAMHVAAEDPTYLKADEIPADVIAREQEIARSQVQGKPPEITEKIVTGKIKAFADQVCLVDQKYVKDNSLTVGQYLEAAAKKEGKPLSLTAFWRWKVGQ